MPRVEQDLGRSLTVKLMNKGHRGVCEVSNTCSSTYVLIDE